MVTRYGTKFDSTLKVEMWMKKYLNATINELRYKTGCKYDIMTYEDCVMKAIEKKLDDPKKTEKSVYSIAYDIFVDEVRALQSLKRGGEYIKCSLDNDSDEHQKIQIVDRTSDYFEVEKFQKIFVDVLKYFLECMEYPELDIPKILEMFDLRFFQEYKLEEIAKMKAINPSTVKNHLGYHDRTVLGRFSQWINSQQYYHSRTINSAMLSYFQNFPNITKQTKIFAISYLEKSLNKKHSENYLYIKEYMEKYSLTDLGIFLDDFRKIIRDNESISLQKIYPYLEFCKEYGYSPTDLLNPQNTLQEVLSPLVNE